MEKNEVASKVKMVIGQVLEVDDAELTENSNFVFDLGASSMQSLELVAGFEEEFKIEMDEDKALEIQTVGDAVDFISEHI